MKERPPIPFRLLDIGLSGKIAGSARPGGMPPKEIDSIIEKLQAGQSPKESGVPARLISNLGFIKSKNINTIYNLISPHNTLTKYVWENHYKGNYITELSGISTAIENGAAPSQEQLQIITKDAIARMEKGENILVHCEGGSGRTGTVITAIYMQATNSDKETALEFIRDIYLKDSVDKEQELSLVSFGSSIQASPQKDKTILTEKESQRKLSDSTQTDLDLSSPTYSNYGKLAISTNKVYPLDLVAVKASNNCCIISSCDKIIYSNLLLNHQALVQEAIRIKKLDELIELGKDEEVANAIIEAADKNGAEAILRIIFENPEADLAIEDLIGKEELRDIGFYKYMSNKSIKIIEAITIQLNSLQKLLTDIFSDNANSLTITTLLLEDLFSLIKSGNNQYTPPPYREPDFEPDFGNVNRNLYINIDGDNKNNSDAIPLYVGNYTIDHTW
jgi:protein-tyrosine phosphatase